MSRTQLELGAALACLVSSVAGLAGWQRVGGEGRGGFRGDTGGRGSPARGGGRGGGRGGRGGSRADFAETRIFVENLSYETTWMRLKDHFVAEGYPVAFASISETPDGMSKGCGLIQFEEADAATHAIERMTGSDLDGRTINCRRDVQSAERRGGGGANGDGQPAVIDAWKNKQWNRVAGTLDAEREIDEAAVADLLTRRDAARADKDFAASDALLNELEDLGAETQ